MQQNFSSAEFVIGSAAEAEEMPHLKPLRPFTDQAIAFLDALSVMLRGSREYPDAASFGFWCRKSALMLEKNKYPDICQRFGRGVVFHSTPSNVPMNFAFSFAAGLLAGNANIVRLPGKNFPQTELVCNAIKTLLKDKFSEMQPYICFVKYASDKAATDAFSALCDVRVVWGGDNTVTKMRNSYLPPRASEITFADRHSFLVVNAREYLGAENKDNIVHYFYNDTYYTDQNACTSPKIVFWLGLEADRAREDFWARVHDMVSERYTLMPIQTVRKLDAVYRAAVSESVYLEKDKDMLITRMVPQQLSDTLMECKYNSGFFFEYEIDSLSEILPVCDRRCQTMTYYGISHDDIGAFLEQSAPHGIDRAVPIGKSMDFSLIWDGHDLIREMSRFISY